MALNFEEKKAVVKQVSELASKSISVGVAQYSGLSVVQMNNLRESASNANVHLQVIKNTLAKIAVDKTDCECISPILSGQVILGFSAEDPGAVARVFSNFIKNNEALVVKGLGVSGSFVEAEKLKSIADLPTKDQAISILMSLMLAPVSNLTRTLNAVPTKLTRTLAAVRDQKQSLN